MSASVSSSAAGAGEPPEAQRPGPGVDADADADTDALRELRRDLDLFDRLSRPKRQREAFGKACQAWSAQYAFVDREGRGLALVPSTRVLSQRLGNLR